MWRQDDQTNSTQPEIKVISSSQPIPKGWRKMTFEEGLVYKNQLTLIVNQWSIVGFDHGYYYGPGYGNKLVKDTGVEPA